ncbi:vWA domain-containing protein [Phaeodactylibacter luteus]|uniref:VWA domain-containing protein n=1 Tax=Phaeodactylibacter luteus TaxID=1564516 RepID=A0A5C6RFN0_9BACT|nr:VWA domain-containing protein [Phaeodactylibacter luteus]TXB60069.1 VWA domain-containing protein [Phaeodactylibacter luteus]
MIGWKFSAFAPGEEGGASFEKLLKLFQELLVHTSGDVSEALSWLTELDKQYSLTDDSYGMADFIQDLIDKGYIQPRDERDPNFVPSAKMEIALRQKALEDVFGQLKKSKRGNHNTRFGGKGDEATSDIRPFQFGDALDQLAVSESLRNAQINHGIDDFHLTHNDLEVKETFYQSQMSTVLMIDISHSMILYGEDRITPAKKVAMALSELITTRYPKDTLDVIVFGNDAWQIEIKDLPYLQVGPYHTNTVAGLELAMDLLRRRKNPNKQIFMITDGKPTCIKKGKRYYKNSFGLDRAIVNRTLNLAQRCRKLDIPVTTFMIARDPYLQNFVEQFTQANNGKAFYSSLQGLGEFIFQDYKNNKGKRYR